MKRADKGDRKRSKWWQFWNRKRSAGSDSLIVYLFMDGNRLTSYFDQMPRRHSQVERVSVGLTNVKVDFGHGGDSTSHAKITQLETFLKESDELLDECGISRRPVNRLAIGDEKRFRIDEFQATRALLPCANTGSHLTVWLDSSEDVEDSVRLYLLADYPRHGSSGLQHLSAFSFLWLLVTGMAAGFKPIGALEADIRAVQDWFAQKAEALAATGETFDEAFARFAKPQDLLEKFGATILPPIAIRTLYEVRYAWREDDGKSREAIFGYPIYVARAANFKPVYADQPLWHAIPKVGHPMDQKPDVLSRFRGKPWRENDTEHALLAIAVSTKTFHGIGTEGFYVFDLLGDPTIVEVATLNRTHNLM